MKKIFITGELPANSIELLKKHYVVEVFSQNRPIRKNELIKLASDADAIVSLLTDKIDKDVIDSMPNCKIIANYAAGFNNIDVEYATQKKIIVTNTPDILTDATADLTIALILACSRRIVEGDKVLRENKFKGWSPNYMLGMDLNRKILGIIGAGRIGTAVIKRAAAFGMKSIYFSRKKNEFIEKNYSARRVSLKKLLTTADIISLHVPLNNSTYKLLNIENLKLLKRTAILINTSRGEVIDEETLIKLLKSKSIHSAGLDVYTNEPKVNPKFMKLKNVVLLPHIGSATIETRMNMATLAIKNVINVLSGIKALTPVNIIKVGYEKK